MVFHEIWYHWYSLLWCRLYQWFLWSSSWQRWFITVHHLGQDVLFSISRAFSYQLNDIKCRANVVKKLKIYLSKSNRKQPNMVHKRQVFSRIQCNLFYQEVNIIWNRIPFDNTNHVEKRKGWNKLVSNPTNIDKTRLVPFRVVGLIFMGPPTSKHLFRILLLMFNKNFPSEMVTIITWIQIILIGQVKWRNSHHFIFTILVSFITPTPCLSQSLL